ncbi:unnamed protein product, partial [Closterium sp. NIES-54]
SEGLGFESQRVHFGHSSARGCQRSTGDPRLILGKGYRLAVLGGYGRTDPLLNKPFYPNGLVVGILTTGYGGTGAAGGTGGAGPGGASAGVPRVGRAGGTGSGGTDAGPVGASAVVLRVGGTGGADTGGATGGTGVGGASRQELLSLQQLREWAVHWGSPGGGAGGTGSGGAVATRAGGSGVPGCLYYSSIAVPTDKQVLATATARLPTACSYSSQGAVPGTQRMALRPSSVPQCVVPSSPPSSSLPHVPDPESDLVRTTSPSVTRLLATVVTDPSFESAVTSALVAKLVDFAALCRLDYAASLVFYSSCPPSVGGELALGCDVLEDRQFELECLVAAAIHLAYTLLCLEGDLDALDIPTPCISTQNEMKARGKATDAGKQLEEELQEDDEDASQGEEEEGVGDLDALPADVWLHIAKEVVERDNCSCSWPLVSCAIAMPCVRRALLGDVPLVFHENCECVPFAVFLAQRIRSFAWLTKQLQSPSDFIIYINEAPPRLLSSLMRSCLFPSLSSISSLDLYFSRSLPSHPRLLFSLSQVPRLGSLSITHEVASDSERDMPRHHGNDPVMVAEMWEIVSIMEEEKVNDKDRSFPVLRILDLDLPTCSPLVVRFVSCISS